MGIYSQINNRLLINYQWKRGKCRTCTKNVSINRETLTLINKIKD